jgi:hypothetical protein
MKTFVMKKNFIGLALGSAAFIFLGCSNPENTGPAAPSFAALTNYETALVVGYSVRLGNDMLVCFTVQAKYKDAAGAPRTEPITTNSWTKTLSNVPLPFEANIAVEYQKKDNVDTGELDENWDNNTYQLTYGQELSINYCYEESDALKTKNKPSKTPSNRIKTEDIPTTNFEAWRDRIVAANDSSAYSYTYTIPR